MEAVSDMRRTDITALLSFSFSLSFLSSLVSRLRVNLSDLNRDAEAETLNFNLICPQRTIGSAARHKNSAWKIKLTK